MIIKFTEFISSLPAIDEVEDIDYKQIWKNDQIRQKGCLTRQELSPAFLSNKIYYIAYIHLITVHNY